MFKDISYYKPDVDSCVERIRRFFSSPPGTLGPLLYTFPGVLEAKGPRLDSYDYETQLTQYLDDYLEYQAELMEMRRGLEDDWVPAVGPYLGIGEYSAFVAGEIEFGPDTSWVQPVLPDKEALDSLKLDPRNKWFLMLNLATRYMVERIAPYRIPFARGYYSPLDLAWSLRGEAIYLDLYEDPAWVHKLLGFCVDAIDWFARAQNAQVFRDGLVHKFASLHTAPDRIAISEDIASLCSPSHYVEFGLPYTQELIRRFGQCDIHCHSAGAHAVPEFLKLRGLRQLQIVDDPNQRRPVTILEELIQRIPSLTDGTADTPALAINASAEEVEQCFELASKAKVVFCVTTATRAEAEEVISIFKAMLRARTLRTAGA